ncbi:MAG: hypothetical protein CSA97_03030 [Bacteroidetes bacterium]|nr:MAG: hypothetical protein CSA97_03030 [Bacteroidota bacterium]
MWEGIASPTLVGRYHSWSVDRNGLPGCLRVSSEDEEERILSLTHKELPIWGVQFHPESYMTHDGVRLIQNWLKEL